MSLRLVKLCKYFASKFKKTYRKHDIIESICHATNSIMLKVKRLKLPQVECVYKPNLGLEVEIKLADTALCTCTKQRKAVFVNIDKL